MEAEPGKNSEGSQEVTATSGGDGIMEGHQEGVNEESSKTPMLMSIYSKHGMPNAKVHVGAAMTREDISVSKQTKDKADVEEHVDEAPVKTSSCCCFQIRRGYITREWPPKFTYIDFCMGLVAFFTFGFDYGTDIRLMIEYVTDGELLLFIITCSFIVVPSLVSGVISYVWYRMTYKRDKQLGYERAKKLYYARICLSFLQLGRLFRQAEFVYNVLHSLRSEKKGKKSSEKDLKYRRRALEENRDAAILGLIDGFMESALQLLLQLYLTIYLSLPGTFPRVSSLVSSWLSTALIVTSYYRTNRKAIRKKQNVDYYSGTFYYLWKLTELGPRYLLLTITAATFQPWCFVFVPVHVIFMVLLLIKFSPQLQGLCSAPSENARDDENMLEADTKTDRRQGRGSFVTSILQYLFVFLMSFVGIFTYINLKEGKTWRITLIYYAVYYAENILMAALFLYYSVATDIITGWTYSLYALPAGILCHTLFAGLYYGYFHPNIWNKHAISCTIKCCC